MLTNPSSDRVKAVRGLSRRSARRRTGRLLVEGPQGVREAVRFAPGSVVDLYVTAEAADRYGEIVDAARAAQRFVHEVTDHTSATTPQSSRSSRWASSAHGIATPLASSWQRGGVPPRPESSPAR